MHPLFDSLTWHNLIGTNMFFSPPQDMPLIDPEMVTPNFDLIGTSRIKLVGNDIVHSSKGNPHIGNLKEFPYSNYYSHAP